MNNNDNSHDENNVFDGKRGRNRPTLFLGGVGPMQIWIETLTSSVTMTLKVESSNTIYDIIAMIKDKLGIPLYIRHMLLVHGEEVVNEKSSLDDCHIEMGSTLFFMVPKQEILTERLHEGVLLVQDHEKRRLLFTQKQLILQKLFIIKYNDGKTFALEVKTSDTIIDVRIQIQRKLGKSKKSKKDVEAMLNAGYDNGCMWMNLIQVIPSKESTFVSRVAFSLEDTITPSIRERLEALKEKQRFWIVYPSGFQELEVRCGDDSFGVNLQHKVCSCRMWELRFLTHACQYQICLNARLEYVDDEREEREFSKWHKGGGMFHESATIDPTALIDFGAIVHSGSLVAGNVRVGSGTVVGPNVTIGQSTKIGFNVALANCTIGRRGEEAQLLSRMEVLTWLHNV
nr:probable UDP-3-O-acylglucosamine N-acyltransferase 2, mitochondrial [Tanacetum cinerariifolium]